VACSESLVRQLSARGAIDPERTILAGHSMGGAIAVLVANRMPVAGVIAISPAPMNPARSIPAFMLPFDGTPKTPAHTLAMAGALDLRAIRQSASEMISGEASATGKYISLPWATHVGILFDSRAAGASQQWAAHVLHFRPVDALPSTGMLVGWLIGLVGLLRLAGPFLRETLGMSFDPKPGQQDGVATQPKRKEIPAERTGVNSTVRTLVELALCSVLAVVLLRFGNPLHVIGIFEGDYFAGFLMLLGAFLLLLHHKQLAAVFHVRPATVLLAAFAAIILHLLIIAWFDLTVSEAWLTAARWLRLPVLAAAVLPYHAAEELLLGPVTAKSAKTRLALALTFRLLAWGALLAGIFLLHSGEILLFLLAPYFALLCALQAIAMRVVRKDTGSPLAAALFGAILFAGFCLVVFPIT
jgi:Alpha/beta hydrolase family